MLPSSNTNNDSTIKERLGSMPEDEFEVMLKLASTPTFNTTNTNPQHEEIIKQLTREGTREGHGDNPTLSNAKYHSSLSSLNNNEAINPSHPPNQNNHHHHHNHTPTPQEPKGHYYGHGHHHYGHLNHTSTLTTIKSTSSLNSVGVDSETSHQNKGPIAYFFNDRDNGKEEANNNIVMYPIMSRTKENETQTQTEINAEAERIAKEWSVQLNQLTNHPKGKKNKKQAKGNNNSKSKGKGKSKGNKSKKQTIIDEAEAKRLADASIITAAQEILRSDDLLIAKQKLKERRKKKCNAFSNQSPVAAPATPSPPPSLPSPISSPDERPMDLNKPDDRAKYEGYRRRAEKNLQAAGRTFKKICKRKISDAEQGQIDKLMAVAVQNRVPTASRSRSTGSGRGFSDNPMHMSPDWESLAYGTGDESGIGNTIDPNTSSSSRPSRFSPETSRSLTPNLPSMPATINNRTPSEGSADRRRPTERLPKKKNTKSNFKVIEVNQIPGYRGKDDLEDLVQFVEGNSAGSNNAKKKAKKERGGGAKAKETLVKSASLDENHLNTRKRSSSSSTERPISKSLKELEKKSERAVSSHQIQISTPQISQPQTTPNVLIISTAVSSTIKRASTQSVLSSKPINKPTAKADALTNKKQQDVEQLNKQQHSSRDDEATERPFELVTKKKKTRKTNTQREAETFSRGKAKDHGWRDQNRNRRVMGGDRRTSACSAPVSENSDQSDDDSGGGSAPTSTAVPEVSATLVNGDYEQNELVDQDDGRSRNSASVSSSVTGGNEAVVLCRGNVDFEFPNQNVGVEFGFNVMENTTYLAWQAPLQKEKEKPRSNQNKEAEPTVSLLDHNQSKEQTEEEQRHQMLSQTLSNFPRLGESEDSRGQIHEEPRHSPSSWHSPPPPSPPSLSSIQNQGQLGRGQQLHQQQQLQHTSYEKPLPRYHQPRGPPPSLLGSYRGPSDRRPSHPPFPGRRGGGGGGSYNNRGRNGDRVGDRGDRERGDRGQLQIQGSSGGGPPSMQQPQQQQPMMMSPSVQYSMPIPLPLPSPTGPPTQVHYSAPPGQVQQVSLPPHPHSHMMPLHYGMMAVASHHPQQQVQNQPPRVPPPPQHHYSMPPPPMVGVGAGGMPLYAYQPQHIPVSSTGAGDDPSQMPQHMQQQPYPMSIPISTGATNNMTMTMPMPLMMPHPNSIQPHTSMDGSGNISSPPAAHPPISTRQTPYIGQVQYGEGGMMIVPNGVTNTYLYYHPQNLYVPTPSAEVESWMNGYVQQTYQKEAAGKLTLYRID